jgi:hypothetical protein
MSKTTTRLGYEYPDENTDPWWALFDALMAQLDATGFASREDRNLFVGGGGLMTWNGSTGTLTWAAGLEVISPLIGVAGTIAAGSKVVADGAWLYVTVTRYAQNAYALTLTTGAQAPNNDNCLVLARRNGTALEWRNGTRMAHEFSGAWPTMLNGLTLAALNAANGANGANPFATEASVSAAVTALTALLGFGRPIVTVAAYEMTGVEPGRFFIGDGAGAVVPFTLPAAATYAGGVIWVKARDITNAVTVLPKGGDTIDNGLVASHVFGSAGDMVGFVQNEATPPTGWERV